jgi:hypothetical protein
MDGPQLVLVTLDGGRVRSIDQFVGDPAAVALASSHPVGQS